MSYPAVQYVAAACCFGVHRAELTLPLLSPHARRPNLRCPTREGTMAQDISRRKLLRSGAVVLAAPAVLRALPAAAQSNVVKIGHVSPKTGPLAGFGEADGF